MIYRAGTEAALHRSSSARSLATRTDADDFPTVSPPPGARLPDPAGRDARRLRGRPGLPSPGDRRAGALWRDPARRADRRLEGRRRRGAAPGAGRRRAGPVVDPVPFAGADRIGDDGAARQPDDRGGRCRAAGGAGKDPAAAGHAVPLDLRADQPHAVRIAGGLSRPAGPGAAVQRLRRAVEPVLHPGRLGRVAPGDRAAIRGRRVSAFPAGAGLSAAWRRRRRHRGAGRLAGRADRCPG